MSKIINTRYDFVLIFDVLDGNPNGDPDAGNLPRADAETGMGLVTDVCIKRKVRNYVQIVKECRRPYDIYVKEKAVLGRSHSVAFKELGINTGQESRKCVPAGLIQMFSEISLPEGLFFSESDDVQEGELIVAADAEKKTIKDWLKEEKPDKSIASFISEALKESKSRKPSTEETEKGREKMCQDFFDIRTFGAVMSLKSAPNCGQVRGPVQFTFARSVEPVVVAEHSITRMAVATENEAEKQSGVNRTMCRKYTIPYGLYRSHGFISSHLAAKTGFSEADLALLWDALKNMFDYDRSAAHGFMSTRKLIVFKHDSALGNASANQLFDLVTIKRADGSMGPARTFADYAITVDQTKCPKGISILEIP